MTFKFEDTEILGELNLVSGTYILVYSEACEERYGKGFTVRYYPGQSSVQPYMDDCDVNIDFADLNGALPQLASFELSEQTDIANWLVEEINRPPLTEAEQAKVHALKQEAARDMFRAYQAKGAECRLVADDTAVEVEFSPGHFMTYDAKVRLKR